MKQEEIALLLLMVSSFLVRFLCLTVYSLALGDKREERKNGDMVLIFDCTLFLLKASCFIFSVDNL